MNIRVKSALIAYIAVTATITNPVAAESFAVGPLNNIEILSGTFNEPAARSPAKYPVVLAHGLLASDTLFSLRHLATAIRQDGTQVFVTEVSAVGSVEFRATQLTAEIIRILQKTGAEKINIVAHSMGGLDARYMVAKSGLAPKVASITTVSTPHRGSPVADDAWRDLESGNFRVIATMINLIASAYNGATRIRTADLKAAVRDLTTRSTELFNIDFPDQSGIFYQSVSASADESEKRNGIHLILKKGHSTIFEREGANDGLVSVRSAIWGRHLGTARADHFTIAGLGRSGVAPFDATSMIRWIIRDLAARGF